MDFCAYLSKNHTNTIPKNERRILEIFVKVAAFSCLLPGNFTVSHISS